MSERDTQNAVIAALSAAFHPEGIFWKNDTGTGKSMDGQRVIKFGCVGSPDILGALDGRAVGVEVKTRRGRQRESQLRFQAAFERAGGLYVVARSTAEALAAIKAARADKVSARA